jgi:hypothetical protein
VLHSTFTSADSAANDDRPRQAARPLLSPVSWRRVNGINGHSIGRSSGTRILHVALPRCFILSGCAVLRRIERQECPPVLAVPHLTQHQSAWLAVRTVVVRERLTPSSQTLAAVMRRRQHVTRCNVAKLLCSWRRRRADQCDHELHHCWLDSLSLVRRRCDLAQLLSQCCNVLAGEH